MSARIRGVKPDVATCLRKNFPGMTSCSLHNLKCMRTLAFLRAKDAQKFIGGITV